MKILAIDSSGNAVSAAIADEEKIIAEYFLNFKSANFVCLQMNVVYRFCCFFVSCKLLKQ